MKLIEGNEIKKIFSSLNESKLNYILMRNINNELPTGLKAGKDIDLLVKKNDENEFIDFFLSNNYQTIDHPFKYDVFLYGVDKFEFKYNNNNNIIFDLNFQIAVRSLDAGQWVPLDKIVQNSAWKNRRIERVRDDFKYWTLSYNDEFVSLVARSIFDKRKFEDGYKKRIDKLLKIVDIKDIIEKFNLVFFKFTPHLMNYIEDKKYDEIVKNYLQFKDY